MRFSALSRLLFVGEELAPPVAPILVVSTNLCKRTPITCLACPSSCTECCHPHNHCKRTIIPRPAPHLPPLPKVRCCRPKKFGRRPEGLPHYYPLDPHQPFQNRTIPPAFRNAIICMRLYAFTSALSLSPHQPSQNRTIPRKSPPPLPPLEKGEVARLI